MTPPTNVLTLNASVFVAAVLPSSMGDTYLRSSSGGWTPYTTCDTASVAQRGSLGTAIQFDVVPIPTDLSSLKGTMIYVGYGIGSTDTEACIDMLNNSTYTQAYTIN